MQQLPALHAINEPWMLAAGCSVKSTFDGFVTNHVIAFFVSE